MYRLYPRDSFNAPSCLGGWRGASILVFDHPGAGTEMMTNHHGPLTKKLTTCYPVARRFPPPLWLHIIRGNHGVWWGRGEMKTTGGSGDIEP